MDSEVGCFLPFSPPGETMCVTYILRFARIASTPGRYGPTEVRRNGSADGISYCFRCQALYPLPELRLGRSRLGFKKSKP
jgi:hypothetical protein